MPAILNHPLCISRVNEWMDGAVATLASGSICRLDCKGIIKLAARRINRDGGAASARPSCSASSGQRGGSDATFVPHRSTRILWYCEPPCQASSRTSVHRAFRARAIPSFSLYNAILIGDGTPVLRNGREWKDQRGWTRSTALFMARWTPRDGIRRDK